MRHDGHRGQDLQHPWIHRRRHSSASFEQDSNYLYYLHRVHRIRYNPLWILLNLCSKLLLNKYQLLHQMHY